MSFRERREFGFFTIPFSITIMTLIIYVLFCFMVDIDRIQRQRKEYLERYTPRGEKLTFGKNEKN